MASKGAVEGKKEFYSLSPNEIKKIDVWDKKVAILYSIIRLY